MQSDRAISAKSAARRQGQRDPEKISFAIAESSFGLVLAARSAKGLCAVLLGDNPDHLMRELQQRFPAAVLAEGEGELAAEVAAFIESPSRSLDAPLDLRGTRFQQTVWQALREIPSGTTASYTEIALRIGQPSAVRAVAQACAANALAVIVPCHRVLRSDGKLSGYRWGIERKRLLLAKEAGARL